MTIANEKFRKWALLFLFALSIFTYFKNIGLNDIWIPNESFYAESAREMLESGNYTDIYYNYHPRFNKPPMTYWLVASSFKLFGISEFSARLPVVILSLLTVFLTYKIALEISDRKTAVFSAVVMFFSFQFIINSRYASPEDVLAFFFTLTLYFFIKGYRSREFKYIFLSYISLGLTILTKGYPYLIVIGGIVFLYMVLERNFNLKKIFDDLKFLKLHIGLPIVFVVGFWWYIYMYLKFGDSFLSILLDETLKRAVSKKDGALNPLFYFVVILWGFLPYSLTFYFSLYRMKEYFHKLLFPFAWFITMMVIFTIAKGKIPTYIIQMHPALSIIAAYCMVNFVPKNGLEKAIYHITFIVPAFLFLVAGVGITFIFGLNPIYYIAAVVLAAVLLYFKEIKIAPFVTALFFFFMFSNSLLPVVERFRPYDQIGKAAKFVDRKYPLIIENYFWHNLPFYVKRKVIRDVPTKVIVEKINKEKGVFALVKKDTFEKLKNVKVLWQGKLYRRGSESRFAIFLRYVAKALHGDYKGFQDRVLIYKE